jgi:transcriptional regulator with XRE-family HTH domain
VNGTLIREIRKAAGLTQAAMGLRFGVEERTIQRWEADANSVPGPAVTLLNQMRDEILRADGVDVPIKEAKPPKKRKRFWGKKPPKRE